MITTFVFLLIFKGFNFKRFETWSHASSLLEVLFTLRHTRKLSSQLRNGKQIRAMSAIGSDAYGDISDQYMSPSTQTDKSPTKDPPVAPIL